MLINKVKKILIFGGGTSGWLTAAYLVKNLTIPCEILLIESTIMGPIGVGEGTQPPTARFLYDCGIDPLTWMKPSQASFKLGVEFVGWTRDKYFVDNDFIENTLIAPNLFTIDYFISQDKNNFYDWLPAYQMAKENKSPKLAGMDTNYAHSGERNWGAVHFNALQIVESLKNIIGNKIEYADTKIVSIEQNENGITALIDENGIKFTGDLYLDCSGFKARLINETLGVEFESITDILPNDKAVVMPTQYTDPKKECFPYTRSTAMNSGWKFTIPIFTRVGNGYVYSSKFITKEDAEAELRNSLNEYEAKANHLEMRCGINRAIAHKNVCAIGLSAGFVEPLEATGITFTTNAVEMLCSALNTTQGIWSNPIKNEINKVYTDMFWEIVSFVWAHYHFSTKNDTPYWQSIRCQTSDMVPKRVSNIVEKFYPLPDRQFFLNPTSSFHIGHWFSVLHAGDAYKNVDYKIDGEVKKYAEYFIKNNQHRINLVKEMFPNHYEFLNEWYNA